MTDHPFDAALALDRTADDAWRGQTSDAYWNMVGPFGGVVAAALFRAAWDHPERQGEPVALTVNFCAALAKGEFAVVARPARTNRSTQHWTMEMSQGDGGAVAIGTAMFGARPDTFAHRRVAPPPAPPFAAVPRTPVGGLGWTDRYDFRFAEGAIDWHGEGAQPGDTRSVLWIRNDPPRPLDMVGLVALCDVFFGRILHLRRRMVPFGTVSMTAFFHATPTDLAAIGDAPLLGVADSRVFDRGFHDQSAELWSERGQLLATSHQTVYYRDQGERR
jgi:acyl-coenzyme A thioesterase PaaI-like protein